MDELLVCMEGIQKYFPGVHALNNCSFELLKGEVHALVGENGAGKSTLMKVLTGLYKKDGGTITYKGSNVEIHSPKEAQNLGIGIIHQELNMLPHLTVAENIFIGREHKAGPFLDSKKTNNEASRLLESLNLNIDPETKIQDLTVAKQQMVEIAKALSFKSEVLIMDEPTAALTESEIESLFKFIKQLKAQGVGIVYISHRLEELLKITDRITTMRDGQYVNTVKTADVTIPEIIQMMVGRAIYEEPKVQSMVPEDAPVSLEVKNLNSKQVKNVAFQLKKGEILGIAGLMGAGRTETARLIFGADPMTSGEIYIDGKKVNIKTPYDAVNHGIGYLSEDRKRFGLALGLSVKDNSSLSGLERFSKIFIVNDKKAEKETNAYVKKINVKTPSIYQLVKNLSGGNQQKVVLAKWLIKNCGILIFDEPTRGIDVGAKSEIYKLMNDLVREGKSIIMISSEMPELLRMSDRVAVMCEGRLTGILNINEATQEKIMTLATQRN
ncbi:monosaccharide ABC transporter ATP-binding protein (CUT2 family) [Anaerobacterium chartisolvens]|uniref:Monosaccharide ABC transporter ATP-binding protein (CUT2 family) n=1 Tax=Anaerobacterium chartisolvens TaxID=1297424 RepID=A0A369AZG0_9FIRM|nr:sugar ABC transporter ATP-binding protein [Anaerobacterium chartisolvens]RCX14822.1 monosaccharide ABC transporter ATP-binding protein (CUT2 family) [Anaerobacterium chartisolvens]